MLEAEQEFWSKLSIDNMMEESDDEENPDRIVTRHIPWHSKCKSKDVLGPKNIT